MNASVVGALVRHIITAAGGGLLASWGLNGSEVEAVAGALAVLAAVVWSVYDKKKLPQLPK